MQQRKMIAYAAAAGLLIGAVIVRIKGGVQTHVHQGWFGDTPLARWQLVAAAAPWVVFSLYWEIAAKNAAAAKSSETSVSRGVHVVLANAALLLEIFPFQQWGRFLPASYLSVGAGCALTMFGLCVAIWARRVLGRNWSGEITIKVEHELIRSGPYKRLRHPIYTGILIMYAGTAVVNGTNLAIVGFLLAAIAYARKIRLEEANLRVAFDAKYDEYCRETWALVPWVY
ncbi:MAG: isoprenylcysteine carboxylmethyltransferase family protein [Terracidiphilus sp.]|jgi:protein-S-isoprenylcysteine O-methyltransferase Ste14